MATIQLTEAEYLAGFEPKKASKSKRLARYVAICLLTIGPAGWGLYSGHNVFSAVWAAVVLASAGLMRLATSFTDRHIAARYAENPFAHDPYTIELRLDGYTVVYKDNVLHLALDELEVIHDLGGVFRLDHWSGSSMRLPKRCMSAEELAIAQHYVSTVEARRGR